MRILETAARLGLGPDQLELYGAEMAKVRTPPSEERPSTARLILVSAITPTVAGEGKTTTSIGLAQALHQQGESVCLALREPSLGPCFGRKGGGVGGGRCQLVPGDRINLHFTGDFHAVTTAHNLLAAVLDNTLYYGNPHAIDPCRILWPRVLDVNDRALRQLVIGLGGRRNGIPREAGFDITAASEIMAILCLAEDLDDLRQRLDRTLLAYTRDGEPLTAGALGVTGALVALLREAVWPNLVRTTEGVPALVHGGPFANIAHGCNSVIATKTALRLADWTITEAGFGFDLGAEKFFDIKCRSAGLAVHAVVLVATVRALKLHGGCPSSELEQPDPAAVQRGLSNLDKHLENIRCFCEPALVALNRFATDSDAEVQVVRQHCAQLGVPFSASDHFQRGGVGALELATLLRECVRGGPVPLRPLYPLEASVPDKVRAVAINMYGARDIVFTRQAERDLGQVERHGYARLPVCVAKTHSSLSDNPALHGRPRDFQITVDAVRVNAGAGFLVVLTGDMLRMPGLPRRPLAQAIELRHGNILGLS